MKINELQQLAIVGEEHISEHLLWLLTAAMFETCDPGDVNLLAFRRDIESINTIWGSFDSKSKSIAMVLWSHFETAREKVQDEAKNTSIRLVLLEEILNTVLHEAFHARGGGENAEDEEGAVEWAKANVWKLGKDFDVNIQDLGPYFEKLISEFLAELIEDTKDEGCKHWKKLQRHILSNNLAFFDDENGTEIRTFREAFEVMASPGEAWDENFQRFPGNTTIQEVPEDPPVQEEEAQMQEISKEEVFIPTEQEIPTMAQTPIQPTPQTITYVPVQNQTQPPQMQNILNTAEVLLRRMFHQIYTKCGEQGGRFANPAAVLETLNVGDIPGIQDLIISTDRIDDMGVYKSQVPFDGTIRGLISRQGLPYYRLWINTGAGVEKRTFIPQNPDKTKADGTLTAWANKVRMGNKIAMLLKDGQGPTAHIELAPTQPLGQEKCVFWNKR